MGIDQVLRLTVFSESFLGLLWAAITDLSGLRIIRALGGVRDFIDIYHLSISSRSTLCGTINYRKVVIPYQRPASVGRITPLS